MTSATSSHVSTSWFFSHIFCSVHTSPLTAQATVQDEPKVEKYHPSACVCCGLELYADAPCAALPTGEPGHAAQVALSESATPPATRASPAQRARLSRLAWW